MMTFGRYVRRSAVSLVALLAVSAGSDTRAERLARVAAVVTDVERSAVMYEQAFGLRRVDYYPTVTSRDYARMLELPESTPPTAIRIAVLVDTDAGTELALLEPVAPPEGWAADRAAAPTLLFDSERIHAVHAVLVEHGCEIVRAPDGEPGGSEPDSLFAVDPDGIRIIVVQNVLPPADSP